MCEMPERALQLLEEMQQLQLQPTFMTYTTEINACGQCGLAERALQLFTCESAGAGVSLAVLRVDAAVGTAHVVTQDGGKRLQSLAAPWWWAAGILAVWVRRSHPRMRQV